MRYILFNRTPDTASWWNEDCLKSKLAIQGIPGMTEDSTPPILDHALNQPSAFTPKTLIDDVRRKRHIPAGIVPPVCILEFDGDITDGLVRDGMAKPFKPWACFHTAMFRMDLEGVTCGIIARTIGGPYAVLIAEQLQAAGAKLIIVVTPGGR